MIREELQKAKVHDEAASDPETEQLDGNAEGEEEEAQEDDMAID